MTTALVTCLISNKIVGCDKTCPSNAARDPDDSQTISYLPAAANSVETTVGFGTEEEEEEEETFRPLFGEAEANVTRNCAQKAATGGGG